MDFVAIDFETATHNASSACQLAIVQVRDSVVVHENSWLIRPRRLYFSPRNIAVHGIRPRDVADAPSMAAIWPVVQKSLEGQVVLAHNAGFDVNVLVASLAAYDIACPDFDFQCTRVLSREAWPGRSRYGLKPLGDWLGIRFKHHDALEDARCCARIGLEIAKQRQATSLKALEELLHIKRGSYRSGKIRNPLSRNRSGGRSGGARQHSDRWGFPASRAGQAVNVNPNVIVSAAAGSAPLTGKKIVLLGPMRGLSIEETYVLVQQLGGEIQQDVESATDYVVACGTTLEEASQLVCQKLALASDSDSGGTPAGVRILSERQFRALLPGGKAATW